MTTSARPSLTDVNMDRLVTETVPSQIRQEQAEIARLEKLLTARKANLRRLLDTAVLFGVELFPQESGSPARASAPDAEPPSSLAGTDGGHVQRVA